MIKLFRNIRQRLLTENKFSKYLIYAIGEIILVVLGILIALQINNWNELRKQNRLEQDYLIALKQEFESNLVEVDRVIKLNARNLKNAQELSKYTGPEIPDITEEKFSQLFFGVIDAEVQYSPGTGVVNEIISSGKLNIFRNKELKNALAALDGLMLKVRFQEKEELAMFRNEIMFLGQDQVSIRKMAFDTYGELFGLEKGRFLESNLHLLTSMQLDGRIAGFIYCSGHLGSRYERLKKQIQGIITIIDTQIE